ncbi:uncharacterized protein LOC141724159 [Apium graveolens]|uniref:uncharacterized protein LOC141724159 n=1 Tax=Apium graveolens TaxID=4045 RepID=UPI003D7B9D80
MDSVDNGKGVTDVGVTDGSWREKRKRGRPRKYGLNAPIIHSVSPLPIADQSPPAGFSSKFLVFPVKNRTLVPTGSVSAGGSQSKALNGAIPESLASGAVHKLPVRRPEPEYRSNMETVEITGTQAQMQAHRIASTVAELNTSFETAKKKIKELGKQVPDLIQIEKWNDQIASWDEKKKKFEKECNEAKQAALKAYGEKHEAQQAALKAVSEKQDLEKKLEKAIKEADDAKAFAKRAINEAALKFVNERRDLEEKLKRAVKQVEGDIEEKLERAVKQVEDAQASGKKAIYETSNSYKICLDNFVASLGNCEGKSLEDHVNELAKTMHHDYVSRADVVVEVTGHEGDGDKKDDAAMQLRLSQRATKPNPKYVQRE